MKQKTSISQCKVRGAARWRVRWHENGVVRRKFFTNRKTAENHAAVLRGEAQSVRQRLMNLSPEDQDRLLAVWDEAQRRGVDLFAVLSRVETTPTKTIAIADVIVDILAVKRASGLSERYLEVFDMILRHFAKGRERLPISALTLADVERYLDSKNIASRTTIRGRISTMMRFAVRRGYRSDNPCERLEPIKQTHKPPAILTLKETRKCLKWLKKHPRSLAWFILSTFAGLRPEEADRTDWGAIHFGEGYIRVEAQTSKIRQRRVVYPPPMVFRWLRLAKRLESQLPIYRVTRIWDLKPLRALLGWPVWKKDVTRHTAASMWLAHEGSADKVATALGHSESVLRKNYMALVTQDQAKAFWALRP